MTDGRAPELRVEGSPTPSASGGAARPSVTLEQQIEEVRREISSRERRYPDLVERGRLRADTAETKLAHLRAAKATLEWLALNAEWIRREAEIRAAEERHRRERELEIEIAEDDPVFREVAEQFPGARVVAVHRIEDERADA